MTLILIIVHNIRFIKQNGFLGSYNTRCLTAVSSFNSGPQYLRNLYKKATNESPGKFTKLYINKLQQEKFNRNRNKCNRLNFGPSTRFYSFITIFN